MKRPHLSRRWLLASTAGGAMGVALTGGAIAPWQSRFAEAQVDPSQPGTDGAAEQSDPALAEVDPAQSGLDPALGAPDAVTTVPATPVVTPEVGILEPVWEPTDAGMATSLGGSDIAVASEGGSHQVDAPKRKVDKILGEKKRP